MAARPPGAMITGAAMGTVAALPLRALAREATVRVVVNGRAEVLDVVCDPRNYGGDGQRFFLCGTCFPRIEASELSSLMSNSRLSPAERKPIGSPLVCFPEGGRYLGTWGKRLH